LSGVLFGGDLVTGAVSDDAFVIWILIGSGNLRLSVGGYGNGNGPDPDGHGECVTVNGTASGNMSGDDILGLESGIVTLSEDYANGILSTLSAYEGDRGRGIVSAGSEGHLSINLYMQHEQNAVNGSYNTTHHIWP